MKKTIGLILPIVVFIGILMMPLDAFHITGLTVIQQRVIAIFCFAALCWVLEPIPNFATSVLVIVLELLLISNKSFFVFQGSGDVFGKPIPFAQIMGTFANPIIMLFMGGFFLALAATKYRLDINLARVLIKPFGTKPAMAMLGILMITAVFSAFMSNTATAAMMVTLLGPILSALPDGDRGRAAIALAVPVGANIGGMATPIGTPPNAIALNYVLQIDPTMTFGKWMAFGVPYVLILCVLAWLVLCMLFPFKAKEFKLTIESEFLKGWKANVVYITFAVTVLLWILGGRHGMNAEVVALIPVGVFVACGIVTKEDVNTQLSWDVLWLVAGGLALGLALDKTGLAKNMVASIPFSEFSPFMVLVIASLVTYGCANFMSHTASANLLLPIIAVMAAGLQGLDHMGGGLGMIISVTFAASLGMTLPISTPPNALASATGFVETPDMAKSGIIIGIMGLVLTLIMLFCLSKINFFAAIGA